MAYTPSHILALTRAAFRQEAEELLAELDTALMRLEAAPTDAPMLNRAFRAIHTMKGSGSTAGFKDISTLLHHVEDMFNDAREGRTAIDSSIVDIVLRMTDIVRKQLQADDAQGPGLLQEGLLLVTLLQQARGGAKTPEPLPASIAPAGPSAARGGRVRTIRFQPDQRVFYSGNDPLVMLQELLALGHGVVRACVEALPPFPELDPELCYLSWEVQLATAEPDERLHEVFLFVQDESTIELGEIASDQAAVLPNEAYFEVDTLKDFVEESEEDITEIEAQVLALEQTTGDTSRLEPLCRTLHNLKGLSHLLLSEVKRPVPHTHPMRGIAELCHAVETYLEPYRGPAGSGLDTDAVQVLLSATDHLRVFLADVSASRACVWPGALREHFPAPETRLLSVPNARAPERVDTVLLSAARQCRDVLAGKLQTGELAGVLSADDAQTMSRALHTLKKAASYGGQVRLRDKAEELMSLCEAAPGQGGAQGDSAMADLVQRYESLAQTIGELERGAAPSIRPKARTISIRPPGQPSTRPSGRPSAHAQSPRQPGPEATAVPSARSVRVDQQKLDRLMRAVGELLVAKNALPLLATRAEVGPTVGKELKELGSRISHISEDLQDTVRAIRMMPVKGVFQRFPRLIRDLARTAGKQVQLVIQGEETELDKTVLEQIADPLVHLVRNAVDHGIESPNDRLAGEKPEMGTVGLEVLNQGSQVVIRICDDGRGMDPDKLRRKAVEKGLLSQSDAQALSEQQVYQLIFLPGFSTADKVTDVSGRGVGMDVVRSNVEQLHGAITIESALGKGTTFSIALPTSLMVSKGILVESAGEQYVLPVESTQEMVKVDRRQIHRFREHSFTNIRGAVCPLASLAELLGLPGAAAGAMENEGEFNAAVVRTARGDAVVLVDRLVAEIDVIVKPLSGALSKIPVFQGASILGDGRVALVLDPARLDLGQQAHSAAIEPAAAQ